MTVLKANKTTNIIWREDWESDSEDEDVVGSYNKNATEWISEGGSKDQDTNPETNHPEN